MGKYLIKWNVGYGENYDEIEADNQKEAEEAAYQSWRDEAESNADYSAEPMTDELREEYNL